MSLRICIATLFAFVLLLAGSAHGAIMLDTPETWNAGLQGWNSGIGVRGTGLSDSPPVNPGAGGNPDGYLQTTFSGTRLNPQDDTLGSSAAAFTGDYAQYNNLTVSFDFYASTLPLASSLYFESSADGSVWTYDVTPTTPTSWDNFQIGFDTGWTEYTTFSNTLDSALADVSMIGLYFFVPAGGAAIDFGVDNWTYSNADMAIPEPRDWALLSMALLSFMLVFPFNRQKIAFAKSGSFQSLCSRCRFGFFSKRS